MKPLIRYSLTSYYIVFLFSFQSCNKEDVPELKTVVIEEITRNTVTVNCEIDSHGKSGIISRGVCWSREPHPSLDDSLLLSDEITDTFTLSVPGLDPRSKYYIRSFAANSEGTGFGPAIAFITLKGNIPELSSDTVTGTSRTSLTCRACVLDDGGFEIIQKGFCYSTSENPTLYGHFVLSGSDTLTFSAIIRNLEVGTKYYIRSFASNSLGTGYGRQITAITEELPEVSSSAVYRIRGNSAKLDGIIINDGGSKSLIRGVCWSTDPDPDLNDNHTVSADAEIAGLTPNTLWYARAYASNSTGTAFGNTVSFNSGYVTGTMLGGGIIFYNDGSGHGLICAPYDQENSSQWGCEGQVLGVFSTAIGSGNGNSSEILSLCPETSNAAGVCNSLILKKYDDWYLPSRDELSQMYTNLKEYDLGGFGGRYYWSSSEYGDIHAWLQDFQTGTVYYSSKSLYLNVRAIRGF
jgi:hypothetical protein